MSSDVASATETAAERGPRGRRCSWPSVVGDRPAVAVAPGATADFALLLIALSKIHQAEQQAMDPLRANTALLPPVLRALALGLLVETVVPLPNEAREESPVPPDQHEGGAEGNAELWQALHGKCGELSALVLRADDPGKAAAYVQRYLAKHLEYVCGVVRGQKRRPVLAPS